MTDFIAPPLPPAVSAAFDSFPVRARGPLIELRRLVFRVAKEKGVGPLTETLKWGEPAYLTEATRTGSTIRLGWHRNAPDHVAIYVNCQTNLVDRFKATFFDAVECSGNRALLQRIGEPTQTGILAICIGMALTYHRDKATEGAVAHG
ncbi:DUF1801 domain-containing protein [Aquibium carbonis]|uniref:DUF1801 domain-containing protein n=1 Tax=Aquibium carbonis TaxID=2495581 RepID=A0A429YVH9_9HYPH|nr:DUF1801 domain-containing protein [Aquibium carbonis]RST85356.1 DUF1801 domain-containing protein [Aquibium carbonis]